MTIIFTFELSLSMNFLCIFLPFIFLYEQKTKILKILSLNEFDISVLRFKFSFKTPDGQKRYLSRIFAVFNFFMDGQPTNRKFRISNFFTKSCKEYTCKYFILGRSDEWTYNKKQCNEFLALYPQNAMQKVRGWKYVRGYNLHLNLYFLTHLHFKKKLAFLVVFWFWLGLWWIKEKSSSTQMINFVCMWDICSQRFLLDNVAKLVILWPYFTLY